mgnify:CR=1 FL=1
MEAVGKAVDIAGVVAIVRLDDLSAAEPLTEALIRAGIFVDGSGMCLVGGKSPGNVFQSWWCDQPGGAGYRHFFDDIGTLDLHQSPDDLVGVTSIRVYAGHADYTPDWRP